MKNEWKPNDNAFFKLDENTILFVRNSSKGVIESHIHLCPKSILDAAKNTSYDYMPPNRNM